MPEVSAESKSPKPARRLKTGGETPRQVHFSSCEEEPLEKPTAAKFSKTQSTCTTPPPALSSQPTEFPQVGPAPGSQQPFGTPGVQWHSSSDPSRSLPNFGHPFAALPQHQGFIPAHQQANTTFIPSSGFPEGFNFTGKFYPQLSTMADYQHTGQPRMGLNFQPPVPDTTFGPMQHTYIPRVDPGYVPGPHQQPVVNGVHVSNPPFIQQSPPATQPVMINGQAYVPAASQFVPIQGNMPPGAPGTTNFVAPGSVPFVAGNTGPPDITGLGRTPLEEQMRQAKFAGENRLFEAQDFKPADDDPSRFYYVRELDGNWTQRNRFTIDHMGDCRWFVTEKGWFYAVRLPD
ncbi:hypothetical protein B0I35DRAFT_422543 [Stachybotrys elegans]|uniref:Uncharacterized protein n=1 Tax=Stachybotrys elegans TaxID=80388 RepID=A0A8K0T3E4_9HYPO|nr:hypothetical protein B0I35DRAFT_422543 [Stachybotrys elegans]